MSSGYHAITYLNFEWQNGLIRKTKETLNELFTSLGVVFHQLYRTYVIYNTNRRRIILQELGLKHVVKQKVTNLNMSVDGSELFPDDIGNILDEFDRDY